MKSKNEIMVKYAEMHMIKVDLRRQGEYAPYEIVYCEALSWVMNYKPVILESIISYKSEMKSEIEIKSRRQSMFDTMHVQDAGREYAKIAVKYATIYYKALEWVLK